MNEKLIESQVNMIESTYSLPEARALKSRGYDASTGLSIEEWDEVFYRLAI